MLQFCLCHTAIYWKNNNFTWDIIMLKTITAITLTLALTACANTDALDESINSLNMKVDVLSAQISTLSAQAADLAEKQQSTAADAQTAKAAAEQAVTDAKAANERIDNVVASYKK